MSREFYGKKQVDHLSARLGVSGIEGSSRTNLRKFG